MKMNYKKPGSFLIINLVILFSCAKQPLVELPITTSSGIALEHYKTAMKHWEVGDDFEKRIHLDSAIMIDPNFALALDMNDVPDRSNRKAYQKKAQSLIEKVTDQERLILLIRDSYRNDNMDNALSYAKELVDKNPNSYEGYDWLGIVQSDRNELDNAIKSFKKAIEINPDDFTAYDFLMGHHIPSGDRVMLPEERRSVDKGLEYGDELIRIRPDAGFPYHFKANCYRQMGEFEKAIPLYEKSIEKRRGKSSEGTALLVSGHNYMFGGDYHTARERYEEAIETTKTKQGWYNLNSYLTWSYVFESNYNGAIKNIEKVRGQLEEKGFSGERLLWNKAISDWAKFVCYAHSQREKKANEALESSISLSRKRATLINDPIVERNTKSSIAYNRAWNHALFGRYDKARESLNELKKIQEKINSPTAMYDYYDLLGMITLSQSKPEEALEHFKKGNPNDTYFLYFKALALKATGDKEGAKEILTDIANTNFSYWELAIMKADAKRTLASI
ncbi:uncharacterized protein METZ01_LOCUS152466 [marine metagenome]|uniref:Uncharacterized protein n=1 Tax=marine metagenome TaxID=408172 RepID=A0A382AET5_9ZZZZ